jgi:hypothetical protein
MLTPEVADSFLQFAGLDAERDPALWDEWQRQLPKLFDRGESLREWAESMQRRRFRPPLQGSAARRQLERRYLVAL